MPLRPAFIRFLLLGSILCLSGIEYPSFAQDRARALTFERVRSDAAARVAESLFRALDVKFQAGRTTILPSSYSTLEAVADVLYRFPDLHLEIAGHSDALGSATTNLRVSEERAEAVKSFLIGRHGIRPERLQTTAYGETSPIATNETPAGRALNRRVEFRIVRIERAPDAADEPRPNADSIREAIQQQVEAAVKTAFGEPDTTQLTDLEQRLQERIDRLEQLIIAEEETGGAQVADPQDIPVAIAPAERRTGLLPFVGVYFRSDLPVVLGMRGDFATTLIGRPRFQPEAAIAFRPDDRASILGANLVFPINLASRPDVTPYVGGGIGFHNLDGFESMLNIVVGVDYQLSFGTLFGEFVTQDFFDFNRLGIGFRQEL